MIAKLEFDGRLGVYDFTDDQYFSWIRANRVLARGERGKIHDSTVRYLADATSPLALEHQFGSLLSEALAGGAGRTRWFDKASHAALR